jgi:predicted nucleic acid-binding protein
MSADNLLFVDTNVLLYSLDSTDTAKHRSARLWLDRLWEHECGCLSRQVLNEFHANATGKIGAPAAIVRRAVETGRKYGTVQVVNPFRTPPEEFFRQHGGNRRAANHTGRNPA